MKKGAVYSLIIILAVSILIYFFIPKSPKIIECQIDSDCIPASCCHSDSCVPKDQKPNCTGIMCTLGCIGPLDCGAGSCGCIKNKCEVTPNENQ